MEKRLKKLFKEAEKIAMHEGWAGSVRVEAFKACALLVIAIALFRRRNVR